MASTLPVNHVNIGKTTVFNPCAYGARGDGATNDTAAIQHAIDACHAAGGGRVFLAVGTYLSGTLNLKSQVELYLDAGAVLRGSPRREDYNTAGNAPYDLDPPGCRVSSAHLINAYKAENIAIRGQGVIDGNGAAFFGPPKADHPLRRFSIPDWRPGHMLAFCECRGIVIEDVHLLNSATYTIWPFGCERVRIQGVTIRNPPETPNGDGIDPTACRDVLISQCFIETADDCVALYSGPANGTFGDEARACENVVVSDCILRSACNAVRIGPHGDGMIRDCVMSNLVIDARVGISMHVYVAMGKGLENTIYDNVRGPRIENIQARNISMRASQSPIFAQILPDSRPPATIRDICFSGMRLYSPGAVCLTGSAHIPMECVELSDMVMHAEPPVQALSAQVPDPIGCLASEACLQIPHAFYLRHLDDVRLHNLRVCWPAAGAGDRTDIKVDKSRNVKREVEQ